MHKMILLDLEALLQLIPRKRLLKCFCVMVKRLLSVESLLITMQILSDGVPYLMDIPFLGKLFKSTNKSKVKTELLIFITPRILTNI